jgi:hypothetical protein
LENEDRRSGQRKPQAALRLGRRRETVRIDEVVDDLDGALGMELPDGLAAEPAADGGDGVALLDREAGEV